MAPFGIPTKPGYRDHDDDCTLGEISLDSGKGPGGHTERETGTESTIERNQTPQASCRAWCGEGDSNPQGIAPTSTSS